MSHYADQSEFDGKPLIRAIDITDAEIDRFRFADSAHKAMQDLLFLMLSREAENYARLQDRMWDEMAQRFGYSTRAELHADGKNLVLQNVLRRLELREAPSRSDK